MLLPTAGEDLAVLRNTYEGVATLDWPAPVYVWVLDDAARPAVADLATEFGFNYSSRPDAGHFRKAGNLQHGLVISSAPLLTILDADFVPRADYFWELVPYLDDPSVGIVEGPQFFDTDKSMILVCCVIAWRAPEYGYGAYARVAAFAVYNAVILFPIVAGRNTRLRWLNPMILRRAIPRYLFPATPPRRSPPAPNRPPPPRSDGRKQFSAIRPGDIPRARSDVVR